MKESRKQSQQEAEKWQESSVRLMHRIRVGIVAVVAITLGWLFIKNMGFPEDVEEILPACVIMENGEARSVEIALTGRVTSYPFKKDEYSLEDWVKVWFGDQWLVEFDYYHGTFDYTIADAWWSGDTVTGMMSRKRDALFLELDVKTIFPEEESQRCILVAPASDKASALELLRTVAPEELVNPMKWVEKIKG